MLLNPLVHKVPNGINQNFNVFAQFLANTWLMDHVKLVEQTQDGTAQNVFVEQDFSWSEANVLPAISIQVTTQQSKTVFVTEDFMETETNV